jgi:IS5 family transposase
VHDTGISMQDATCYESRISFPTDVKLLWNCCHESYVFIQQKRKKLRLRKSRINYNKHRDHFKNYQKTKKKTRRQEKKLRKQLLKFLLKQLQHRAELNEKYAVTLSSKERKKICSYYEGI